jgi:hypothetical protein
MRYVVVDRRGQMQSDSDGDHIDAVLAELDEPEDAEHPDVSLTLAGGWTLSAYPAGRLIWENVEQNGPPRHMIDVPRERVKGLWLVLAAGHVTSIEAEPWLAGHGNLLTEG